LTSTANDRLVSITDQFNNVTSIERLADGTPSAIISPDGLRTELNIDESNQLTGITYPDGNTYSFEYENNDGLLTAKNEPNGNRFEHFFDVDGRITHTNNQEGGLWQFSKSESADGNVISTITTPNTTMTIDRLSRTNGAETKTLRLVTGDQITSTTSADGLEIVREQTCGPKTETFNDLDRKYGYTYPQSMTLTTRQG